MEFIFVCLWYARHPGLTHGNVRTVALSRATDKLVFLTVSQIALEGAVRKQALQSQRR